MPGSYRALVVKDESQRLVEGFANVAVLDRQNDIVPTEAMAKAMLAYMKRGGIILLGHANKPVGKVLQWHVDRPEGSKADGIHIIASIDEGTTIADAAWQGLKEKTYTGFSIGGSARDISQVHDKAAAGGMARELKDIELNEISLVNIPANQLAMVDAMSMAKGMTDMDEDGHPIVKGSVYVGSLADADAAAQKLKHEGKVVRRITQAEESGPKSWCLEWQYTVNPSNDQSREEQHPAPSKLTEKPAQPIQEHKVGTHKALTNKQARVIEALKVAGLIFKGDDSSSGLMSVLPLIVDAEGEPEEEEEKAESTPHPMQLEQNTNFTNDKYGVTAIDGALTEKDEGDAVAAEATSSSTAGVAHARLSPEQVQKPVRSKAQWGWLYANRPDLAHKWTSGEEGKQPSYDKLPEHVKSFDEPRPDNGKGEQDNLKTEAENKSEKVHGGDAFNRTDRFVAQEYDGDGKLADSRVVNIHEKDATAKPAPSKHPEAAPAMPKPPKPSYGIHGPPLTRSLGKTCEICESSVEHESKLQGHDVCLACIQSGRAHEYPFEEKEQRGASTEYNVGQSGLGRESGMNLSVERKGVRKLLVGLAKADPVQSAKREHVASQQRGDKASAGRETKRFVRQGRQATQATRPVAKPVSPASVPKAKPAVAAKPAAKPAENDFKPAVGSEGHRTPSGWEGKESRGYRSPQGWHGREAMWSKKELALRKFLIALANA